MFEKAVRNKLRFNYKGLLSVEDLWDLSLTDLDKIYKNLIKQQKELNEDSLLQKETKESERLNLSINIIKHIVNTKVQEDEKRQDQISRKLQREKIASIISKKQDEHLEKMSLDDLKKTLSSLSE